MTVLINKISNIKKNNLFRFLAVVLLLSFFLTSCDNNTKIKAEKGVIDLTHSNLKDGEILQLNGEWEFYYNQLISPSDFHSGTGIFKRDFISVPKSWTHQKDYKNYPKYGYATYRLKILTNDTITPVMLENQRIFTAYKIWLNGELIKSVGEISKNKTGFIPDLKLCLSEPVYLKKKNELIIQVANYADRHAGIMSSVRISEYRSFYLHKIIELIIMVSVLSIIFIMGLYHFIFFLFVKSDYSYLIFSILALCFILLGVFGTDTLLKNILSPNFKIITRFFHTIVSLYPTLIFLFFYLLFKNEVNKKLLFVSLVISGLLFFFSLTFPIDVVRKYVIIKVIFILIVSFYFIIFSLPKAIFNKRQGAIWAYTGMILLFITNINDILFSLDILKTSYLAVYGFVSYIIFQSLNIAERFSFSFKKNLKLSKDLRNQNKELQAAKAKAENADLLKSAFLANMSHEIRTPMNAILGFSDMLTVEKIDNEKRVRLVNYIIKSGNSLLKLINDIIDISKIEADQLEISKAKHSITVLFDELESLYNKNNNVNIPSEISMRFLADPKSDFEINTDGVRLKQVLINLIDNALKFTEKGFIEISYKLIKNNQVVFCVQDSGIGLSEEQKKMIFKRFTKLENEGDKLYRGAGLGLSICKNIIQLLDGKIWVKSELNKGTAFYFSIPVK